MIAAIEEKHQVVWGVGRTDTEALADAHHQARMKQGIRMGKLRCVPLDKKADINSMDGEGLWPYCRLDDDDQEEQLDLL